MGPSGPCHGRAKARLLLRSNANVNEADGKGVTPLHIAVFDGHLDMAKVLLSARADVWGLDLVTW